MAGDGVSDIVVVSAFGRGNWLAAELASLGMSVTLVETSEQFGRWTPEDWEGPFGYFHTDKLLASQRARLIEEDDADDLPEGLTIWLKNGPIDFRSPLSPHLLSESGVSSKALRFLSDYDSMTPDQIALLGTELARQPFSQSWLVHLAYQLASHVYRDNAHGMSYGRPLPFFSPWLVRRVSRKGAGHSLDWVMSKGVRIYSGAGVIDISADGTLINSIEIQSSWSGAVLGRQFVWMMSGEETQMLSKRIADFLYPKGILKSTWSWIRYRVKLAKGRYLDNIPGKFILIGDLFAPWTHANLLIVQRTVQSEDLDVWIRIPSQHRFQRAYLEQKGDEILELLRERIPGCAATINDRPQDYLYEYQELGPSRFPIYREEDIRELRRAQFSNLIYSGVEDWTLLEWSSILRDQIEVVNKLHQWKRNLDSKSEVSSEASL